MIALHDMILFTFVFDNKDIIRINKDLKVIKVLETDRCNNLEKKKRHEFASITRMGIVPLIN